jgi:glutamate racemase
LQAAGIDQLVLGCTHFPFLTPVLQDILGPQVEIVDPGPAIARQTGRIIVDKQNAPGHEGQVNYYTSGDPVAFRSLARRLLDEPVNNGQVRGVRWDEELGRIGATD